jgi:hypothetical protein
MFALIALLLSSPAPAARADEVYTFVVKKQEKKAQNRWSLSEWLETRDRMRLMDLWLAIHSPSPYEYYVGADYRMAEPAGGARETSVRLHAAAYATIFGLEVQRELSPRDEWMGLFLLRIFGFHAQATNITLHAGLRSRDAGAVAVRGAVAGLSMSLYLARFFGVEAMYRHLFSAAPNAAGVTDSGRRIEGGAYLDFRFLRIYGSYFHSSAGASEKGTCFGTRLYF